MKKRILAVILTLMLLVGMIAIPSTVVGANGAPKVILGFCLDSSGSIGSSNWTLVKTGLSNAVGNSIYMPQDGSVEICIVLFSTTTQVILEPTAVTAANVASIQATIMAMPYLNGMTAMGDGINLCLNTMNNSAYWNTAGVWKVMNLATDGEPNQYPSGYDGNTWAEKAVNDAVAGGLQELDVEAITTAPDANWLATKIAYPDGTGAGIAPIVPDESYPPRPPNVGFEGFVRRCPTFADYEDAVKQKLTLLLKGKLSLSPPTAQNVVNTKHCVTATLLDGLLQPVAGATIDFVVTGANPTSGSAGPTNASGQAVFCYTGTVTGIDKITASCPDPENSAITLTAEAAKEWIIGQTTPTPVEVGGDIYPISKVALLTPLFASAIILAGAAILVWRRRAQS